MLSRLGSAHGAEYFAWENAKKRHKYPHSFAVFLQTIGPRPSSKRAWLRLQPDGTFAWRRGYKLTESDVQEIRSMRRAGFIFREIAARFGISVRFTQQIVQMKKWV
jgi:hypothetical protein